MSTFHKVRAQYKKPLVVFISSLIAIFIINVYTIHYLYDLNIFLPWGVELLNGSIMVILLFPVVYFFLFRPLALSVVERDLAQEELQKARVELEERVKKRTNDLTIANNFLQNEIAERKRMEDALQHSLGNLRQTMGGIIQTLVLTVEARDPYTAGHQRRVSNLARTIASEMELSREEIEGVRLAGIIHDLGKLSIPIQVLKKAGPLSTDEYDLIKTHTRVAFDILKTIDFPWPIAQIVFQHHERMNGSGYPLGISGEDILVEARILAVADVIEAMTSYRHYRPPFPLATALEEISTNKGILYDSKVVEACLTIFNEKGFKIDSVV